MNIKLDPWQKEFLDCKGDKMLCTGRQVGKSVMCGKDCAKWALANPNKVVLMIAPTERQAFALFDKTLNELIAINRLSLKKGRLRPTKTKINLKNGTVIWCLPTGLSGLGIRFLTVHRLYAEEASRIPELVWDAITPMLLTTGGETIYLSTPWGTSGYFYDVLINKNNAFDNVTRFRKNSEDVMKEREICETWTQFQRDKALERLSAERLRMSALAYAQEYEGKPMSDLRQVFPDELLREVMILNRRDTILNGRHYFLGQDIAGMGRDLSTWVILDGTNRKKITQVECITKRLTRTPERVDTTLKLERQYKFKRIGIDDGGLGSGDFGYLLRHTETKRKVEGLNNASREVDREGKKRKRLLKEDMYNNLLAMMEHKEIELLKDDDIFESLRSVQFEITSGKAKYFGEDTHIAEGLIRAAWLARNKGLNIYLY